MHTVENDLWLELFDLDISTNAKEQLQVELNVELNPGVEKIFLKLKPASRHDQRPDTERVSNALGKGRLCWSKTALRALPGAIRQGALGETTVTLDDGQTRVLDAEPGNTSAQCYGVAFDLGTTTIVGYLFDLTSGEELFIKSIMNPQRNYGADVIARIKHVRERGQEAQDELHTVLRSGINALLKVLCRETSVKPRHVYKTVFAGNPTILHFLLGLNPSGIDHSPYIPVTRDLVKFSGSDLQLEMHPEGHVLVLPSLSAYVGADITSGVLATQMHRSNSTNMLVDIGTNAEIVLGNRHRLLACSSPAGPAFEGAEIQCGMSANPGAISHVRLSEEDVELEVIGGVEPKGICGSGLIDLVGQLLELELVTNKGNLCRPDDVPAGNRVSQGENQQPQFLVSDGEHPIHLTQKDIRELQLAKGAVRAGVDIVLLEFGTRAEQLDHIYLAGAFGNFMQVENVLRVGLLPDVLLEKIVPVGNAAGTGAKLCLLNTEKLFELQTLAEQMEYFELSNYEKFSDVFMGSMLFPKRSTQQLNPAR